MDNSQLAGEDKENYVHSVFEDIAPKYDFMNDLTSFRFHKMWRKKAMKKLGVKPGSAAIDICCGTADWTMDLANCSKTGRVVGLDFSASMLAIGRVKLDKSALEAVELVEGNAMELPFPVDSFDYATIGFALRNVPDVKQVLREMERVVKPGGKVASLELSKPTLPVFKSLYYFYFYKILPILGKIFAGSYEQYSWLPTSLTNFPDRKELATIFAEVGLINIEVYSLTGGIAAIHIGEKRVTEDGV